VGGVLTTLIIVVAFLAIETVVMSSRLASSIRRAFIAFAANSSCRREGTIALTTTAKKRVLMRTITTSRPALHRRRTTNTSTVSCWIAAMLTEAIVTTATGVERIITMTSAPFIVSFRLLSAVVVAEGEEVEEEGAQQRSASPAMDRRWVALGARARLALGIC